MNPLPLLATEVDLSKEGRKESPVKIEPESDNEMVYSLSTKTTLLPPMAIFKSRAHKIFETRPLTKILTLLPAPSWPSKEESQTDTSGKACSDPVENQNGAENNLSKIHMSSKYGEKTTKTGDDFLTKEGRSGFANKESRGYSQKLTTADTLGLAGEPKLVSNNNMDISRAESVYSGSDHGSESDNQEACKRYRLSRNFKADGNDSEYEKILNRLIDTNSIDFLLEFEIPLTDKLSEFLCCNISVITKENIDRHPDESVETWIKRCNEVLQRKLIKKRKDQMLRMVFRKLIRFLVSKRSQEKPINIEFKDYKFEAFLRHYSEKKPERLREAVDVNKYPSKKKLKAFFREFPELTNDIDEVLHNGSFFESLLKKRRFTVARIIGIYTKSFVMQQKDRNYTVKAIAQNIKSYPWSDDDLSASCNEISNIIRNVQGKPEQKFKYSYKKAEPSKAALARLASRPDSSPTRQVGLGALAPLQEGSESVERSEKEEKTERAEKAEKRAPKAEIGEIGKGGFEGPQEGSVVGSEVGGQGEDGSNN